jgi:hypothetical protein
MRNPTLVFFLTATAATLLAGASCSTTQRSFGTATGGASSSSSGNGVSSSSSTAGSGGMGTGGGGTGGSTDPNCAVPGSPVDCTDPVCTKAGYTCTPTVPAGWQGPAVLYTGTTPPPDCGVFWAQSPIATAGIGVTAPPATCATCTCGAPSGDGCAPTAQVELPDSANCVGGPVFNPAVSGGCLSLGFTPTLSLRAGPLLATGGSCAAAGGKPTVVPPTFTTQVGLCAPETTGGGCTAGVCVPMAPSGYGAGVCIYQDGDVACPTGPYPTKTLLYTGFDDTRSCSSCACGAPSGGTCPATLNTYIYDPQYSACALTGPSYPADGTCISESNEFSGIVLLQAGGPSGGACAASGGSPTGTATAAMPVTVCCG